MKRKIIVNQILLYNKKNKFIFPSCNQDTKSKEVAKLISTIIFTLIFDLLYLFFKRKNVSINNIYSEYQQKLTAKNKTEALEIAKRGYRENSKEDNKKKINIIFQKIKEL